MLCKVLKKNLRYSNDGFHVHIANEGDVVEIQDGIVPGLIEAGDIKKASKKEAAAISGDQESADDEADGEEPDPGAAGDDDGDGDRGNPGAAGDDED